MNYRRWIAVCMAELMAEHLSTKESPDSKRLKQPFRQLFGCELSWTGPLADTVIKSYGRKISQLNISQLTEVILANKHFYPKGLEDEIPRVRSLRQFTHPGIADNSLIVRYGLPLLATMADIHKWLNINESDLDWLSQRYRYDGSIVSANHHYRYRWIQKRNGSLRLLEAPKSRLKLIQTKILKDIFRQIPTHPQSYGSVKGSSYHHHAASHIGQALVLSFDLKDFFSSVTYQKVFRLFRSMGYPQSVTRCLSKLATHSTPGSIIPGNIIQAAYTNYQETLSIPHLPQGSPYSPAIANLTARHLDKRLSGLAESVGLYYSRYIDDFVFSGPKISSQIIEQFRTLVDSIVLEEGFYPNYKKFTVMKASQSQKITGCIVNSKLNISRRDYDQLKALLFNCIRFGPHSQNHQRHEQFSDHLLGRISHVHQLNAIKGNKLLQLYNRINFSDEQKTLT